MVRLIILFGIMHFGYFSVIIHTVTTRQLSWRLPAQNDGKPNAVRWILNCYYFCFKFRRFSQVGLILQMHISIAMGVIIYCCSFVNDLPEYALWDSIAHPFGTVLIEIFKSRRLIGLLKQMISLTELELVREGIMNEKICWKYTHLKYPLGTIPLGRGPKCLSITHQRLVRLSCPGYLICPSR